jgi:hypothetical protein
MFAAVNVDAPPYRKECGVKHFAATLSNLKQVTAVTRNAFVSCEALIVQIFRPDTSRAGKYGSPILELDRVAQRISARHNVFADETSKEKHKGKTPAFLIGFRRSNSDDHFTNARKHVFLK